MSATELKIRVLAVLDYEIKRHAELALDVRRSEGVATERGEQKAPSSRIEDIAFKILELNAFRRGVEAARNTVIEEHQKLIAPESIPSGAAKEEALEPLY